MKRRRNPSVGGLSWAYGLQGVVDLKQRGVIELPLKSIVALQQVVGDSDEIVSIADDVAGALLIAAVDSAGKTEIIVEDYIPYLGWHLLTLRNEKLLPDRFVRPLMSRIRGMLKGRKRGERYTDHWALNLLTIPEMSMLIVAGFMEQRT